MAQRVVIILQFGEFCYKYGHNTFMETSIILMKTETDLFLEKSDVFSFSRFDGLSIQ